MILIEQKVYKNEFYDAFFLATFMNEEGSKANSSWSFVKHYSEEDEEAKAWIDIWGIQTH